MTTQRTILITAVALAAFLDLAANYLAAHYLIPIAGFIIPGGTFLFALAFTTYDFLRRQGGTWPTICAITAGFLLSLLYALAFGGGLARIAIAGLIALACSSTTDLLMQNLTIRWPIWRYVGTCNAVSLLVDSVVFTTIAFALLPIAVRLHILEGQYLAKLAMTALSIPLVYYARSLAPAPRQRPKPA